MNPSKSTAFESLSDDVEDAIVPPMTIPPGLIPTLAAPVSKPTKAALRKLKEAAALEAAAAQEAELQKLAESFTHQASRANHKKALEAAIATGDAEAIAALPSEAETIEKGVQANKQIRERIRKTRVAAADDLEAFTAKAIKMILAERAEAEAALLELYRARNLTEPLPSVIGDSYTRRCQELRNYAQTFRAGGGALGPVLKELIG